MGPAKIPTKNNTSRQSMDNIFRNRKESQSDAGPSVLNYTLVGRDVQRVARFYDGRCLVQIRNGTNADAAVQAGAGEGVVVSGLQTT